MIRDFFFGRHQETDEKEWSKFKYEFYDDQLVIIVNFGIGDSEELIVDERTKKLPETKLRQKNYLICQLYHRSFNSWVRDLSHYNEGSSMRQQHQNDYLENLKDNLLFF